METKGKIKVIKKGTIKTVEPKTIVKKNSTKVAAREMVANVTNWVTDFQHRRREETKQAFEQLFNQPQANNV